MIPGFIGVSAKKKTVKSYSMILTVCTAGLRILAWFAMLASLNF